MSGSVHLLLGRLTFEGESALFILFIISVVVAMGTFACLAWYLLKFRSSIQWICIEGALEDVNFGVLGVRVSYNYEYELKHKAIIDRFGRYPHRNAILGRESSLDEIEFLKQPGSSF